MMLKLITIRRESAIIVLALCTFLLITVRNKYSLRCNHSSDVSLIQIDSVPAADTRSLLVIGIISADHRRFNRDTQRQTWISYALNTDLPLRFIYRFLIDEPTVQTEAENDVHNDIVYLNVTTHGYAIKEGEKVYVWFKYIHDHFPDALLGAKIDDDVFVCVPQIFDRLAILQSHTLYYGWGHTLPGNIVGHIDEMFVVIGDTLIERIAKREYCYTNTTIWCDLEELDWGDLSLQKWISIYKDVDRQADNSYIIHFGRDSFKENAHLINKTFCDKYILYHKAIPRVMRLLHKFQIS